MPLPGASAAAAQRSVRRANDDGGVPVAFVWGRLLRAVWRPPVAATAAAVQHASMASDELVHGGG